MDFDKLITIGKEIRENLTKILITVGGSLSDYMSGAELADYAAKNNGKPIFIDGEFRMVYIKDNSYHDANKYNEEVNKENNLNRSFRSGSKVHLYYCGTLITMVNQGRYTRYRVSPEIKNKRIIDLRDKKNIEARLLWCQNCINALYSGQGYYDPQEIAEYGDAEELMDRVKERPAAIKIMIEFTRELEGIIPPTDYPRYWPEISKEYRKKHKYTCKICGVNCSAHTGLIDVHHKNGVKTDCRDENLECLCKYHHAELHPHYKKAMEKDYPEIMQKLQKLWEEQNISPDKYNFHRDIDDHSKTSGTETPTTKHDFHRDRDNHSKTLGTETPTTKHNLHRDEDNHSKTSGTETPTTEHDFHRDNGNHNKEIKLDTNNCHIAISGGIMHFYYCRTMIARSEQGYKDRYRAISKIDNAQIMELKNKENLGTRPTWCKNCLAVLWKNGEVSRGGYVLNQMAKYGDAEELMACVEAHANNDPSAAEKIQNFVKKYHAEIT